MERGVALRRLRNDVHSVWYRCCNSFHTSTELPQANKNARKNNSVAPKGVNTGMREKLAKMAAKLAKPTTSSSPLPPPPPDTMSLNLQRPTYIKTKRLDKTARFIMEILNKEAVAEVLKERVVPRVRAGYVLDLKVEVLENKRRIQQIKGIVIAVRNAGIHTTFRIRRNVGGTAVETVLPLYSPLLKEIKVLERKRVRSAKLYYLRIPKAKLKLRRPPQTPK